MLWNLVKRFEIAEMHIQTCFLCNEFQYTLCLSVFSTHILQVTKYRPLTKVVLSNHDSELGLNDRVVPIFLPVPAENSGKSCSPPGYVLLLRYSLNQSAILYLLDKI